MFSPRDRKIGRLWLFQSSFFSTIRYRLRETQIPYTKNCWTSARFRDMSFELMIHELRTTKIRILKPGGIPNSKGWSTHINFQAGDGDMEPHTGPSGTTPELRQPHRTTWEPAPKPPEPSEPTPDPHRNHWPHWNLRKLPEPVGNRHRKPPRPLSVLRPLS